MASSRSLGSLTLDLILKAGGFITGMTAAERAANKSLTAMEKRAYAFGNTLGKGIKLGAVAATAALAGFGTLYIKNTIEAEKISAQLNARIKALGGTAAVSAVQVNKLADSLQASTTFDDESITEASTALLAFTNVGADQFARTLAASLDLATASGDDLTATAEKLGKALNEPEKAAKLLRAEGIALTDTQKELIKSLTDAGRVGEAQGIILTELESRYKGAAEAARNTLGGALTGLKNTFDNLLEGDSGSSGIKGTIDAVNDFNDSLNDPAIKSGIDSIAGGIAGITAELITGIAQFANYISRARELSALANGELKAADASYDALNDRIGENASMIARTKDQRTSFLGFDIPSLVQERKDALKALDAERVTLQREVTKRIKADASAELFSGVTATVNRAPVPKAGSTSKGKGGSGSADRDAARAAAEAKRQAEDAAKAIREAAEAQYDWHQRILDMQANLDGPAAEINRDYQRQIQDLDAAFSAGEVTLSDYAAAQEIYGKSRDESLSKVEKELTPYEEVNAAIQEQIALLGMSAEEQEIYNNLKAAGVDANSEFGKSIIQSTKDLQTFREEAMFMDDIKDGLKDVFVDFISGAKSAKDAWEDFSQQLFKRAAQFVADQAINALFDAFSGGGNAGGSSGGGGGWADLFKTFLGSFGGGKASGGAISPNSFYRVNESGMEMATVNGNDYLLTGSRGGTITPAHQLGGGTQQVINMTVQGRIDRRSEQQIAREIGQQTRIAGGRG